MIYVNETNQVITCSSLCMDLLLALNAAAALYDAIRDGDVKPSPREMETAHMDVQAALARLADARRACEGELP